MPIAETIFQNFFVDLSAYPRWLVVLVGTFIAAFIIWILIKVMKWALWLLLFAVLAGGVFYSIWLLLQ